MAEITYLLGDPDGAGFLAGARGYFTQRPDTVVVPTEGGQPATTLEDVLTDLRTRADAGETFSVINLVCAATGFSALPFPVSEAHRDDTGGQITADVLVTALVKAGTEGYPAVLGEPAVTADTTLVLHGPDVGRDDRFLVMLAQLFGPEVTVYAPLRCSVFRSTGAAYEHRQARTWSVTHDSDITTATDWDAARTQFLTRGVAKFAGADADLEAALRAAAADATATSTGTFFLAGGLATGADPAAHPVAGTSAVLATGAADDTTVPVEVTAADFDPDPARPGSWRAWLARLAQVLEEPVSLEDPGHYRKTVLHGQRAPSETPLVPTTTPTEAPMSEFYGKYRGTVVDTEDPEGKGRLQVEVPSLSITGAWAEASVPPVPKSLRLLPREGSTVWVEFEAGDAASPIWTGVTWDADVFSPDPTLEHDTDLVLESDTLVRLRAMDLQLVAEGALGLLGSSVGVNASNNVAIQASGGVSAQAATLSVNAASSTFTGVLQSQMLIATAGVVSPSYTPGAGNIA